MYTIIGDGRVANHFAHYLQLLRLPFRRWSRRIESDSIQMTALRSSLEDSTHVLILISDSAIESFADRYAEWLKGKTRVHFSGSLVSQNVCGAHPLMTFSPELYDFETYRNLPFVLDQGRGAFEDLLPGVPNPHYFIDPLERPLYHALCVMSGNFTTILWNKLFRELSARFDIPEESAYPYLNQICRNLQNRGVSALTGPLARRDLATIRANLQALERDEFRPVYEAFLNAMSIDNPVE